MSSNRITASATMLKRLSTACVAAVAALAVATPVAAAEFPSGPVTLVVPWGTGGGTDRSARTFAPYLSDELGVPVNVVNISGGGGWVAWAQMADWDPEADDHKIGFVNLPHVFAYLDPEMGRDETVDDFNFVSGQTYDPCMWLVNGDDDRFETFQDFIDYGKENPDDLVVSSTAIGSDDYQGLAYAEKMIDGFSVDKVYANNDAKKVQEVLGGHTDAVAGNVSYYVPYIADGRLKPLAVLGTERSQFLPSVPTFKEVTGVDNICFAGRTLVVAPGLPEEKKQVYMDAIQQAQENPEYAIKALNNNSTVWKVRGEELTQFIKSTEERVKTVEYWNR